MTCAQFYCSVCGVLAPGKPLPSPKRAVAALLPNQLLFGWWSSLVQWLPSPLKEAATDQQDMICASSGQHGGTVYNKQGKEQIFEGDCSSTILKEETKQKISFVSTCQKRKP